MEKILLVEDDVADWEPLKMFLEINNYIVDIAESVMQVQSLLKEKEPYTFVITDMELRNQAGLKNGEKKGGMKVVKAVLGFNNHLKEKIVVLSGRMDDGDERKEELIVSGIRKEMILTKPVSPDDIMARIK